MLLALDLATHLGWALGSPDMNRPTWGSFKLPSTGENVGRFVIAFDEWLTNLVDAAPIDQIVMEASILPDNTQRSTLLKLYGLAIKCEELGERRGIDVSEVRMQSWRKHFIGRAIAPTSIKGADRRRWIKRACMDACRARGWDVEDDNAADALGILDYSLCLISQPYRARTFTLQAQISNGALS